MRRRDLCRDIVIVLMIAYVATGSYFSHDIGKLDVICNYAYSYLIECSVFYLIAACLLVYKRSNRVTLHPLIVGFMIIAYLMIFVQLTYFDSRSGSKCTDVIQHHNDIWAFVFMSVCFHILFSVILIVIYGWKIIKCIIRLGSRHEDEYDSLRDNP